MRTANSLLLFIGLMAQLNILKAQPYQHEHPIDFDPQQYMCNYIEESLVIDGKLNDQAWEDIPWTTDFVDIQGELIEKPFLQTRVKMCWDKDYFYVATEMHEPHIWAKLTERDAIMYHDDDFEIFIDPDGDGHNYFEFEMNAHNAIWDLYMLYPYRIDDGRNYIMNWDIRGILHGVDIHGSLNDPSDIDSSWSVEVAIPWETFKDFKAGRHKPRNGDQWRINFSRVDWTMDIVDGAYVKVLGKNNRPLPENNWVWSPMGYINMHKPELWGYVQFVNKAEQQFEVKPTEAIKWGLWQLYYQMKECRSDSSAASCTLDQLTMPPELSHKPISDISLHSDPYGFTISLLNANRSKYTINEKAKLELHSLDKSN